MVRIQIHLEERQVAALKKLAAVRKQSIAQLIRMSVDVLVQREGEARAARVERAKSIVGLFSSNSPDGSHLHDRHLADAVREREYEQIREAYLRQPDSAAEADDWSSAEEWKLV